MLIPHRGIIRWSPSNQEMRQRRKLRWLAVSLSSPYPFGGMAIGKGILAILNFEYANSISCT